MKKTLILAFITAVGLPVLLAADRSISAIAEPNHGPIQILACRATYDSDELVVSLDFKNNSEKAVTSVGFSFTAEDAFGQALRSLQKVRTGDSAPGTEVDNWQGASVSLPGPVGSDLSDVACSVETVHFKDGTEWSAGDADSTPAYPPTANPDGTPLRR